MREIKFRAWYAKEQRMLTNVAPGTVTYFDDSGNAPAIDCELMQYTGLHDKNGKEIYEGDIVSHRKMDGDSDGLRYGIAEVLIDDSPHEVKWLHAGFYPFSGWVDITDLEYEVIGNIFENSNLLENGKTNN